MQENQENLTVETREQQDQSNEFIPEEYDKQNELFENTAQKLLTQSIDVPDETRQKIENLVNEHNLETSIIKTFTELYKIYGNDIDFTRAIGNQQISEQNTDDYFGFIGKNSEEIINLLKNNSMIVMGALSSIRLNNENENGNVKTRESFLTQIYAIPSTLDKNDYEINEISYVDTFNDQDGKISNEHLLYSILNKTCEKSTSTVIGYNETNTENTITGKEINNTEKLRLLGQTGMNYIIGNLRIEPVLNGKGNQEKHSNGEPIYKITFNLYTPKQNDKQ